MKGTVDFERLSVDAPELFAAPLNAGDGRLQIDLQLRPEQWIISRMDYRSKDLAIGVKGQMRRAADTDTQLQFDLTSNPMSVAIFKKYFPARWLALPQIDTLLSAFTDGELLLHKAGVKASVDEIRRWESTGSNERLWFDLEIRKATATFPGGYAPLRAVNGRVALEKGRIAFNHISASSGQSRIADLEGSYDLQPGAGGLQLRARGEADLGELREQARRGILPPELTKAIMSVQALGGKSKFDIALTRHADGAPLAQGKLALENARLQWDTYALTDIDGDLTFTPSEIRSEKMRALIHGSPVEMRLVFSELRGSRRYIRLVGRVHRRQSGHANQHASRKRIHARSGHCTRFGSLPRFD